MTLLDWGIAVFTFLLALWGFRQGLIVGALGLAGLAAGAVLGSRLAPVFLDHGSNSPYAPLAALVGALVAGFLADRVGAKFEGRITDITTRYTVIRAPSGRESIVPNETLITSTVENLLNWSVTVGCVGMWPATIYPYHHPLWCLLTTPRRPPARWRVRRWPRPPPAAR